MHLYLMTKHFNMIINIVYRDARHCFECQVATKGENKHLNTIIYVEGCF